MVKYGISILLFSILVFIGCVRSKNVSVIADESKSVNEAVILINTIDPYNSVNFQLDLYKKGVVFYATDSTKSWELIIIKDSCISFDLNGIHYSFANPMHSYQGDSIIKYYTLNESQGVIILIEEKPYASGLKKTNCPFSVKVLFKNSDSDKEYNGGGFYVVNSSIHDIWVLDSLDGKKVQLENFPSGFPQLEFHLDGGRVMGFGGCNNFTGTFYAIADEMHFNTFTVTMKMFAGYTGEQDFLRILGKSRYTYSIENIRLRFMHRGSQSAVAVFKKVD